MAARRGHCPEILFESEPATTQQRGQVSLSRLAHYQEYRRGGAGRCTHESVGVSLIKSDARHSERGWILLLNYHRRNQISRLVSLQPFWRRAICGLSFVFASNKENESKQDIRIGRPMDINSDHADKANKLRPIDFRYRLYLWRSVNARKQSILFVSSIRA